jgi:IS5 family transposase
LQQLHNISDESLEYQVNDRLSFMQFLGFDLTSEVPDATMVWLFRNLSGGYFFLVAQKTFLRLMRDNKYSL